jgi:predicted Zn-dependent protease
MHMNRAQEREADKNGAQLLARANMSVSGLRAFFERLAAKDEQSRVLSFLHSHPASAERAQSLTDPGNLKTVPLLSKKEWASLKNYCKDTPGAS